MSRQKKDQGKQWKASQLAELVASMPMAPAQLSRLLDYLGEHLRTCDHTSKMTEIFLHVEKLDKTVVLPWLGTQGGYCDCEVLNNLVDLDNEIRNTSHPGYFAPTPKAKNSPRDLRNPGGWDLAKLPAPWRVGNLYAVDEPIQLQMGKKTGCVLRIVDEPMPPGDQTADGYWANLWHARVAARLGTTLPDRGPLRVGHDAIRVPANFRVTVVQTPQWTPVFGWILPADGCWSVEIETELNRAAGDFTHIAALIGRLVGGVM